MAILLKRIKVYEMKKTVYKASCILRGLQCSTAPKQAVLSLFVTTADARIQLMLNTAGISCVFRILDPHTTREIDTNLKVKTVFVVDYYLLFIKKYTNVVVV